MLVSNNADVAAKVRGVAAERAIRHSVLASSVPLSPMAMSRRMSGQTPFEPEELIKIARALGTPVATFFGETAIEQIGVTTAAS